MSNKVYDVLKYIAMIVLPAIATLYFAIGKVWGLPYVTEIVGTITAVDTFMGALLGISSANWPGDGSISLHDDGSSTVIFTEDPEGKDKVTFQIK